jgi:hypothetical protein
MFIALVKAFMPQAGVKRSRFTPAWIVSGTIDLYKHFVPTALCPCLLWQEKVPGLQQHN